MAKDHQLHLCVHLFVRRSSDPLDQTAQQQIDESEAPPGRRRPDRTNALVDGGSVVYVPFTTGLGLSADEVASLEDLLVDTNPPSRKIQAVEPQGNELAPAK